MKDKVAEVFGLSENSSEDLKHEICGPDVTKYYRKLWIEKCQIDGYCILLKSYLQSLFRDFESYLRILTGLNEDDIQLLLKQYNSKFKTYKISPVVYTFKDLSEVLPGSFKSEFEIRKLRPNHKHDNSNSILIDGDNVSLITKFTLRPDIKALRFDDKSFFNTIFGFSPHWIYKSIASYDIEYYSEKNQKF